MKKVGKVEDVDLATFRAKVLEEAGIESTPEVDRYLEEAYRRNAKRALASGVHVAASWLKSWYSGVYLVLGCATQRSGLVSLVQDDEGKTGTMVGLAPAGDGGVEGDPADQFRKRKHRHDLCLDRIRGAPRGARCRREAPGESL